jgi:hypothetical protein
MARSYDAVMNMFAAPVQWVDLPTKIVRFSGHDEYGIMGERT